MRIDSLAGKPADPSVLVNVPKLVAAYYLLRPDPSDPRQQVVFGTSGHRGSAFDGAFNEWHILAITQAICDYRKLRRIDGPVILGMDTHALSEPAFGSALEVLAANNIEVMLSEGTPYTPTSGIAKSLGYGSAIPGGEHAGTVGVVDYHHISCLEICAGKRISRLLSPSNRAVAGFRSRTEGAAIQVLIIRDERPFAWQRIWSVVSSNTTNEIA